MREIKFRAWSKENHCMYDVDTLSFRGNSSPTIYGKNSNWIADADTAPLMQFTGLKDENGKEIYEGDIITCYAVQREIHDEIEDGTRVVVSYKDGYFYPFGYNAGWRSQVGDIQVLGNLYENPELLNL